MMSRPQHTTGGLVALPFAASLLLALSITAKEIQVEPGADTLLAAVTAGGLDATFVLKNDGIYTLSRTLELRGNQSIKSARPCESFSDQAIIQSSGNQILDVALRSQRHFYTFPGDLTDPGGRWYWLPVGLSEVAANPQSPEYAGPHAGKDGTQITLTGMSHEALEGETYLNAWNDDANSDDFERINTYLDVGIRTYGDHQIEGVEMRGFRVPFETARGSIHLRLYRSKWIAAKTAVRIDGGGLHMDTCWGSAGSQRVQTWEHIKSTHLRDVQNQGKRQLLSGKNVTGDVILENSGFYDYFDGVLGAFPQKLHIINCLWDSPRMDDAVQLGQNPVYGDVWIYRNIIIGSGPSWNRDGSGIDNSKSGRFLTEETFIAAGRDVRRQGYVRDRQVMATHGPSPYMDPHDFHRCTFLNFNSMDGRRNQTDKTYTGVGGGNTPHQWYDCLTYRLTRTGIPSAKLGSGYHMGTVDIRRTVIIDGNPLNDMDDAFEDGGSFDEWKAKNDPKALYIPHYGLTEAEILAKPNRGAILAGREAGAVSLDARAPWGQLGPDWLLSNDIPPGAYRHP